jgi:hypothetical protein
MTKNRDLEGGHTQWMPIIVNDKVKHWICSCGVIVPDLVDPHPEESLEILIDEMVRASREFLATPIGDHETAAMIEMRASLKAAIDEYDRSKE